MLDQSFSAENFRTILDIENRKGVHVEKKLSMNSVKLINEAIRDCNKLIRINRKNGETEKVKDLYAKKKDLRTQKESELEKELEKISKNVTKNSFKLQLDKVDRPNHKTIYTTPNVPEHFFALKQIQRNISKLFAVKQADRIAIIEQVASLLEDKFPKYIIRTDIKDFYETIPQEPLLKKIYNDNLLSPISKKLLRDILNFNHSGVGIPRGVGASAYLAELFMRDIDDDIRNIDGVIYYARYVDDIVIMFTPVFSMAINDYQVELEKIITNKGLFLNEDKTDLIDLTKNASTQLKNLEYLGYLFEITGQNINIAFTEAKRNKYKNRIISTFNDYENQSKWNEKKARQIFVKRVRFLTGNTRLTNNKKGILIGIYYSNKLLTTLRCTGSA